MDNHILVNATLELLYIKNRWDWSKNKKQITKRKQMLIVIERLIYKKKSKYKDGWLKKLIAKGKDAVDLVAIITR